MRSFFATAVVLSLTGVGLPAQTDPGGGWTPTLELRVLSSYPDGARANASGTLLLAKAEPARKTVWSGATLCMVGIGGDEPMPAAAAPANVWKVNGDYLGEQGGRHQVRVTSGFTRLGGRDSSATVTQTLSLRNGDRVVLDAMSGPVDAACQVHTVTLEAQLVLRPAEPALARARYAADLWLVHTDPSGREQREHLVTNVDFSGAAPFVFNRLAFPLPQIDARQGNIEATIQLRGSLRARTRTDGLVDLDIETSRAMYGLDNPDHISTWPAATTQRTLTLKDEETTAIEFPPARGFSAMALGPTGRAGVSAGRGGAAAGPATGNAEAAVEVNGNLLRLYTDRFFKGHRTQLLVRLRRLP